MKYLLSSVFSDVSSRLSRILNMVVCFSEVLIIKVAKKNHSQNPSSHYYFKNPSEKSEIGNQTFQPNLPN